MQTTFKILTNGKVYWVVAECNGETWTVYGATKYHHKARTARNQFASAEAA